MRELRQPQSHGRPEVEARSMAIGLHEGRLHQGEPRSILEAGPGNSFSRSVRKAKGGVQQVGEENRSVVVTRHHRWRSGLAFLSCRAKSRHFSFLASTTRILVPAKSKRFLDFARNDRMGALAQKKAGVNQTAPSRADRPGANRLCAVLRERRWLPRRGMWFCRTPLSPRLHPRLLRDRCPTMASRP